MKNIELIATASFGLEAVVKREIEALGYEITDSRDGRITFKGDERAIVRSNLWLRCADRVYVKLGEFEAQTFEQLFERTKALPWAEWIPEDGKFTVVGTSAHSQLHSVPGCQSIVKKAVVNSLKEVYKTDWFSETGAEYTIRFMIQKDIVTLMIDSSGSGLHKRGYRVQTVTAPIKETLAAAMVQLSFFKAGRLLVDPFCGSGTIAIEAAMIARNIAPGLSAKFASEDWQRIPKEIWQEEKKAAYAAIDYDADVRIKASDIDRKAIEAAKENAAEAGVDDCIEFSVLPFYKFEPQEDHGIIITNPPYGERIGDQKQLDLIYKDLARLCKEDPTWSLFLITADKSFEKKFGRNADRRRKLYNGRIETCYYQYHGKK